MLTHALTDRLNTFYINSLKQLAKYLLFIIFVLGISVAISVHKNIIEWTTCFLKSLFYVILFLKLPYLSAVGLLDFFPVLLHRTLVLYSLFPIRFICLASFLICLSSLCLFSSPPIFQLCCCHLCSPLALWRIRKSSSVYWTTSTQLVFHNCRSMFLSHSFFVSSLSLSFPLLCLTLSLPLFINSGLQIAAEWINDPLALYCVRWCLWVFVCMHVWMPSLVRH